MKYKTLVTGKNATIIDDFFVQMGDNFEVISTSTRFGDIMRHIKYFNPDLFVYCLSNEPRESISQMVNIKDSLLRSRVPVIILGSKEECDEFEKIAVNVAALTLVKPFTAVSIQEDILKYVEDREAYFEAKEAQKTEKEREREEMLKEIEREKEAAARERAEKAAEKAASEAETDAAKESGKDENTAPPAEEPAQRKHILVVDDDPLMLKMLKEHLHGEYDVATAVSGKIALKFLERKKTNLILLDYEMPGENGPEILEKIHANDATKDIPVIFLTGVSDRDKIQEALALRPQSYLLKPIDREKLLDSITKIIG
ncbi:MAG: response regulator [Roseburia sp.]|nr:response regulator [Roseburia sp.]